MPEDSPGGPVTWRARRQRKRRSIETADANDSKISFRVECHNCSIEPPAIVADLASLGHHDILVERLTRAMAPELPLLALRPK